jgi:hypothetical protein
MRTGQNQNSDQLKVVHNGYDRNKHLEGLTSDEQAVIKLMASIYVNSILNMKSKQ